MPFGACGSNAPGKREPGQRHPPSDDAIGHGRHIDGLAIMAIKKALVVDDSRVARFTLAKLLRTRGIQVDMADSGAQAIEYLHGAHPDVVFMDYMMPEMNGLEATRAITGNPATSAVPVVFCTGNDTTEDRKQAMEHGASSFLTKGGSEEEIDGVLASIEQMVAEASEPSSTPATDHGTVLDVDGGLAL